MNYVDLGKIETRSRNRKKTKKNRIYKILFYSLVLVLVGYLLYSFKPIAEKGIKAIIQGPSIVLSFLKNDVSRLDKSEGRTNILLLGIDKRSQVPYSYQGLGGEIKKNGFLADTIIVASYKHEDSSLALLSIPRDLWVEIPSFGGISERYAKINSTYSIGDLEGYTGGGLELTKQVVGTILNLPIHYAARIDFEGFKKGIDLVGGVDVEVETTFDDFMYPREGYENAPNLEDRYLHVHFDAGWQHMDGERALQFARSRYALGPEGSDFARAKRQQKVLMAARDEALSLDWADDFGTIKEAYSTFGEMIESDVPISDLPLFISLAKKIVPSEAKTHVLGDLSENNSSEQILYNPPQEQFGGAWVLIPSTGNWSEVHDYVRDILFPAETLE